MQETLSVKSNEELIQGDIIFLEQTDRCSYNPQLGVIINADCDLAHRKIDNTVSFLPIYTFREYLDIFWAPKYISEQEKSHIERVKTICEISGEEDNNIRRWLESADATEVAEKLIKIFRISKKQTKELHDRLAKLKILVNGNDLNVISLLCRLELHPVLTVKKAIAQAFSAMGDGHFFINDIVGRPEVGFVVRMRRILSIETSRCFLSRASLLAKSNEETVNAIRIARLNSPYRFKLAQQFAYHYSRIGLPDEITGLSALAIDDIVDHISGGIP